MTRMSSWERQIGSFLSGMRLDSIKNKIVVLALLATLLPTLATAIVSYNQNKRALTEGLTEELQSVGSQIARELDLWIRDRFYEVQVFSGSFEVSENLERIPRGGRQGAEALSRLSDYLIAVQQRSDYTELLAQNPAGELVTSSDDSSDAVSIPAEWDAPLRAGDAMLGDPYWDARRGRPLALVAEPINAQSRQQYLGILAGKLDFDAVTRLLRQFAPGDSGRAYFVTDNGTVVASSAPIEGGLTTVVARSVLDALGTNPGGTVEYTTDGVGVIGTLQPIPRLRGIVIAEIPRDEVYAPITRLRNVTVLLVSVLLLIVGSIAYLLGVFIVRPLGRLTAGADEVAAGDFSVDLPVTGGGEVEDLTRVFNNMVDRLQAGRAALDNATAELRDQNLELERLSITDGLTDLTNRRRAMEIFDEEIQRAGRLESTLSVLMMDVDHFKRFNDTYGHLEGDAALRGVAKAIKQATRGIDTPARYGGEEFLVLLPKCEHAGAVEAANRIRDRLSEEVFPGGKLTMSIGAASYPLQGDTPEALIGAADAALYQAKEQGRDRVVVADDGATTPPKRDPKKTTTKKKTATAKKRSKRKGPPKAD